MSVPYDKTPNLWPNISDQFFRQRTFQPVRQSGPHCVSTALAILSGAAPEASQGRVNTQDPRSWSDALQMSVLSEEALAHGENADVVGRRAAGGQALVAALCGFSADRPAKPDVSDEMTDEIRAEAREAAAILWKRMAEL